MVVEAQHEMKGFLDVPDMILNVNCSQETSDQKSSERRLQDDRSFYLKIIERWFYFVHGKTFHLCIVVVHKSFLFSIKALDLQSCFEFGKIVV